MPRCSFVVFLVVVVALGMSVETRGGNPSFRPNVAAEFPFLVGLTAAGTHGGTNRHTVVCTGTLLSPVFVLSSAYCTSNLTSKIKVYWKTPANVVKYHLTKSVYIHPSYDQATRKFDLSLIKLKKPFNNGERFVGLSSKTFKTDVELNCMFVGIGTPQERGYKVPVRVKYGRTACRVPKSNPGLEYVIGYTWADFLCAETVGLVTRRLPCDRADPLLCSGGRLQYGIFGYGYEGTGTSPATEAIECGDPAVQSRHLFVNRHTGWIAETMAKLTTDSDGDGPRHSEDANRGNETTKRHHRPKRPRPTQAAASNRPEVSSTAAGRVEVDYPYLVYLEGLPDEPVCGGTLISAWHVLTTAYCTTRMTEIVVTVMTYRRQRVNASLVYIHPDFNSYTLTADISIVLLREPLNVTRYAQIADVVVVAGNATKALDGCVVAARRRLTPYHYVPISVKYGPKACRETLDSEIQSTVNSTWREFICGMPNRRLRNDTGDPLICDGLQYGIISHSYRTGTRAAETGSTDQVRFLVIDYHRGWIDDVIAADDRLCTSDGSPHTSAGLAVVVVFQSVQFLWSRRG